jgi:hypothetical protein
VVQSAKLSHAFVRTHVLHMLDVHSKGMFLWVVLVLQELKAIMLLAEVEQAILTMPDSLHGVFKHIMRRLARTLWVLQQKFRCKLLKLLVPAKHALLMDEVHEALQLNYALDSASVGTSCKLLLDDTELVLICGLMATVWNWSIRLIHLTAHEYLKCDPADLKVDAELREFFVDVGTGNAGITGLCTKYLSTHCVARAEQAERVNT